MTMKNGHLWRAYKEDNGPDADISYTNVKQNKHFTSVKLE